MITVLQYLVIGVAIGLLIFAMGVLVFGRGEQLAPLPPRTSPTELPDDGIDGNDVRKLRFAMSLRGYRMSDVDWALDKLAAELDALRGVANSSQDTVENPAEGAATSESADNDPVPAQRPE